MRLVRIIETFDQHTFKAPLDDFSRIWKMKHHGSPMVVRIRGAMLFLNVQQSTEQSRREIRILLLESLSNTGTFSKWNTCRTLNILELVVQ
jgi:hypothetical protein